MGYRKVLSYQAACIPLPVYSGKDAASLIRPEALYKYVDFPKRSGFSGSDELVNRIWNVADTTFRLASGIFLS